MSTYIESSSAAEQEAKINEAFRAFSRGLGADASLSSRHSSRIKPAALSLPFLSPLSVSLPFIYKCNIFTFLQFCECRKLAGNGRISLDFSGFCGRTLIGHMLLSRSVSSCSRSIMERFNHRREKRGKNEGKEHNK